METGVAHRRFCGLNSGLSALFWLKNGGKTVFQISSVVDSSNEPASQMMKTGDMGRIVRAPLGVSRRLLHALPRGRVVIRRQENYRGYVAHFPTASGVQPLFPDLPQQAVPYVFPVWFDAVDEVYAGLRAAGLPVFRWDRAWPGTPRLEGDHGLAWSRQVAVSLPSGFEYGGYPLYCAACLRVGGRFRYRVCLMKTDTLFYRLFQAYPALALEVAGIVVDDPQGYQFRAEEVKETAFRLDGLLIPPPTTPQAPLVFWKRRCKRITNFMDGSGRNCFSICIVGQDRIRRGRRW